MYLYGPMERVCSTIRFDYQIIDVLSYGSDYCCTYFQSPRRPPRRRKKLVGPFFFQTIRNIVEFLANLCVRFRDYRYSWLRDSSFSIYALIRLGFVDEADEYMKYLSLLLKNRTGDHSLQIMYTIRGSRDIPEFELLHLDGHKGSIHSLSFVPSKFTNRFFRFPRISFLIPFLFRNLQLINPL